MIRIAAAVVVEMAALEAQVASVGTVRESSVALAVRRSRPRRARFLWAAALVQERRTTDHSGIPSRIPAEIIVEQTAPASIAAAGQEAASSSFTREPSLVLEPSAPTGSRPSRRRTMVVAEVAQAARFLYLPPVVALAGLPPMLMAALEEPPGQSRRRARFLAI